MGCFTNMCQTTSNAYEVSEMKEKKHVLYKIYYGDVLVYLGRTNQPLQNRLRGHFFKKPMHRVIDINQVTRIECAEFPTEADMYLYEVYYINLFKPRFNVDDRAQDDITVTLPEVEFVPYECPLFDNWKEEISRTNDEFQILYDEWKELPQKLSVLHMQYRNNEFSKDEYREQRDALQRRKEELKEKIFGRN